MERVYYYMASEGVGGGGGQVCFNFCKMGVGNNYVLEKEMIIVLINCYVICVSTYGMACGKSKIGCQSLISARETALFVLYHALYYSISFCICWSTVIGLFKMAYR